MEKSQFLDTNRGLTPLLKCKYWGFFEPMFYSLNGLFSIENFTKYFLDKSHGVTPLEKCKFRGVFGTDVFPV